MTNRFGRDALSHLAVAMFATMTCGQLARAQAPDFEQTLQIDGVPETYQELVFGMSPDATDGLDDGEDIVPPSPPAQKNTIAFSPPGVPSHVLKDVRAPADDKSWPTIVTKGDDQDLVIHWTADAWNGVDPAPNLVLSGTALDQDYDLTQPSPVGGVVVSETTTLWITYGTPVVPQEGSLVVTSATDGAQWRILETNGAEVIVGEGDEQVNLSTNAEGDPFWRPALPGQVLQNIPSGDYLVTFNDIDASLVTPADETVTISDGETVTLNMDYATRGAEFAFDPTALNLLENGPAGTIGVVLGSQPVNDVTVTITVADEASGSTDRDAAAFSGGTPTGAYSFSLTFSPGDWAGLAPDDPVEKTFDATPVDDDALSGNNLGPDIFGEVLLLNAVLASDDSRYDGLEGAVDASARVFVVDDDVPGLVVAPLRGLVTDEDGGAATFTVSLNAAPTAGVRVLVMPSDLTEGAVTSLNDVGIDGNPDTVQLGFDAANWDTPQQVTVTGQDDADADGTVPYTIDIEVENGASAPEYHDLSRAAHVRNVDNDAAGGLPPETQEVRFLPDSTMHFGLLSVGGGARTRTVTVINGSGSDVDLFAETSAGSQFAVKAPAGYVAGQAVPITVAANDTAEIRLQYTAGAAAAAHQDTLLVTYDDGAVHTVGAIALVGRTVPVPDGGVLSFEAPLSVVSPGAGGGTAQVELDVDLNNQQTFTQFSFFLSVPSDVVTDVSVATNTGRTNGIPFSQFDLGAGVYAFEFFDFSGVGIAPGDGTVLSLDLTVDTSGGESAQLLSLSDTTAFGDNTYYDVVGGGSILAVSDRVVAAHLDVSGDGTVNMTDLILIFRWTVSSITSGDVDQISPDAWGATAEQKDAFRQAVQDLLDSGRLDVSGDGTVNMTDLILIFRWTVSSITKEDVDQISPDAWGATPEQRQTFRDNVQAILPLE